MLALQRDDPIFPALHRENDFKSAFFQIAHATVCACIWIAASICFFFMIPILLKKK